MLTKFIFVLSLMTNEGDLQMKAFDVSECPDKTTFYNEMEKMRKEGHFISWEALCIDRNMKTEEVSND